MFHILCVRAQVRVPPSADGHVTKSKNVKILEAPGIDPGTSRMLSERSTI